MRAMKTRNKEVQDPSVLGPTLTPEVILRRDPCEALLDTGSPVTIVSLEFLLQTWAHQKPIDQTTADWEAEVKARLTPPTLTLKNYGGDELTIIRQVTVEISQDITPAESYSAGVKEPPLYVLVGTDLKAALGFLLLQTGKDETATDQLKAGQWKVAQVHVQRLDDDSPPSKNVNETLQSL